MRLTSVMVAVSLLFGCSNSGVTLVDSSVFIRAENQLFKSDMQAKAFSLAANRINQTVTDEMKERMGVKCASLARKKIDINGDRIDDHFAVAHVSRECDPATAATVLMITTKKAESNSISMLHTEYVDFSVILTEPGVDNYEAAAAIKITEMLEFPIFSAHRLPEWREDSFTPAIRRKDDGSEGYIFEDLSEQSVYSLARTEKLPVWCYVYGSVKCVVFPPGRSSMVKLFEARAPSLDFQSLRDASMRREAKVEALHLLAGGFEDQP